MATQSAVLAGLIKLAASHGLIPSQYSADTTVAATTTSTTITANLAPPTGVLFNTVAYELQISGLNAATVIGAIDILGFDGTSTETLDAIAAAAAAVAARGGTYRGIIRSELVNITNLSQVQAIVKASGVTTTFTAELTAIALD